MNISELFDQCADKQMTAIYKYRIRCLTDNKNEFIWAESEPVLCPINTSHSIDATKTAIVEKRDNNSFEIKEEFTPTGGHFQCDTKTILEHILDEYVYLGNYAGSVSFAHASVFLNDDLR